MPGGRTALIPRRYCQLTTCGRLIPYLPTMGPKNFRARVYCSITCSNESRRGQLAHATEGGYIQHLRRGVPFPEDAGETPCGCRAAHTEYARSWEQAHPETGRRARLRRKAYNRATRELVVRHQREHKRLRDRFLRELESAAASMPGTEDEGRSPVQAAS